MDFIERLFGVSPDGGNGSTELVYFILIALIAAGVVSGWRYRKSLKKSHFR